eukprot:750463-Hanusia_phi.AAC.3
MLSRRFYTLLPAAHCKDMSCGDVVVAVDGMNVKGKSCQEVLDMIQGASGTTVCLTTRPSGLKSLPKQQRLGVDQQDMIGTCGSPDRIMWFERQRRGGGGPAASLLLLCASSLSIAIPSRARLVRQPRRKDSELIGPLQPEVAAMPGVGVRDTLTVTPHPRKGSPRVVVRKFTSEIASLRRSPDGRSLYISVR